MDINKEEDIQIKPMRYLVKISLIFLISYLSFKTSGQIKKDVEENSALSCLQGVWQPINSKNEELTEYIIYNSFYSVSIRYTDNGETEGTIFIINGFYDFDDGYALSDSLKVNELNVY